MSRLRQNSIFRLSLLYFALFFVSSGITLLVSYHTIKKNIQLSVEREVNAEITRYIGTYQSNQIGIAPSQYAFFIEQNGRKVAGNLTQIPLTIDNKLSEVNAKVEKPSEPSVSSQNSKVNLLGKTVEVGNTKLFIGKSDYGNVKQDDIFDTLISSLVILLIVGTTGGLLISYNATKRIDKISKISRLIMKGNLSLRIPKSKYNDDIEDLTTNLNLMLDKISDLMQNLRQVSNNIAHDLRTPLTRLRWHIESIEKATKDSDTRIEAESAIIEIDNLLSTFSALLRIANIDSGSADSYLQEINVKNLIDEVVDFYEVLAEEKRQTIIIDHAEGINKILADKDMITQAIINILTNAIKYTSEEGVINITTKKVDEYIVIKIKDSGDGVPEEVLPKLTQHFYRLEEHRNNEGNGLGLALVKAIVKHHKGKLNIYNDNGLNVEISIPNL